jgi:hypothetical protein
MTRRTTALVAALALLLSACAAVETPLGDLGADAGAEQPPQARAETAAPADTATVVPAADPAEATLGVTKTLWQQAPVVHVAAAEDESAAAAAATAAADLPGPVLLLPSGTGGADAVAGELERLEATTVVTYGTVDDASFGDIEVVASTDPDAAPEVQSPDPLPGVVVLIGTDPALAPARATAEAAGTRVTETGTPDPRADSAVVQAIAAEPVEHVVAVGEDFGNPEQLWWRTQVAARGVELPGGGQVLFPGRRLVALYGHPGTSSLGVLGEQGPEESVERAQQLASEYEPFSDEPVLPAFEIIATVASSFPGTDGDYSNEAEIETLLPHVEAAGDAGVYVVLDLQPGRTDFLSQAGLYEELLRLPHVGLALDPEWRLERNQVHLRQIGRVGAAEIDEVADWLAGIVREERLPQKLLLLHQFRTSMITERETLDATRDELAYLVQMDGDGAPGDKFATWEALKQDPPEGLYFGWKNFYDEDAPTFSPEETFAVEPKPWWVSYQ